MKKVTKEVKFLLKTAGIFSRKGAKTQRKASPDFGLDPNSQSF
jgi:hypothetical protein